MLRELAKAQDDSGNMEERILGALHDSIGHKIREHVEEAVRKAHHKERELEKKQDEANNSQSIDWGIDESLKGKQRVVWHVQRYAQTLYEAIIGFVSLSPMTFNTIPARIIKLDAGAIGNAFGGIAAGHCDGDIVRRFTAKTDSEGRSIQQFRSAVTDRTDVEPCGVIIEVDQFHIRRMFRVIA